jgi:hypothetical protein
LRGRGRDGEGVDMLVVMLAESVEGWTEKKVK